MPLLWRGWGPLKGLNWLCFSMISLRSKKTSQGLMRYWWRWKRSRPVTRTKSQLIRLSITAFKLLVLIPFISCISILNWTTISSTPLQSILKLRSRSCPMIYQENWQKGESLWTITRSKESFLNSKTMSFGSSLKNLRKSMTTSKTSSIRRQETRWMNGLDWSIDMETNLRNLSLFALSVDSIWVTTISTWTAKRTLRMFWKVELQPLKIQSIWVQNWAMLVCTTQRMSHRWNKSARKDISSEDLALKVWPQTKELDLK